MVFVFLTSLFFPTLAWRMRFAPIKWKHLQITIVFCQNLSNPAFIFRKKRNENTTSFSQQEATTVDHMRYDLLAFTHLKTRKWIIHPKNLPPWNQPWKVRLIFFSFWACTWTRVEGKPCVPKGSPCNKSNELIISPSAVFSLVPSVLQQPVGRDTQALKPKIG